MFCKISYIPRTIEGRKLPRTVQNYDSNAYRSFTYLHRSDSVPRGDRPTLFYGPRLGIDLLDNVAYYSYPHYGLLTGCARKKQQEGANTVHSTMHYAI